MRRGRCTRARQSPKHAGRLVETEALGIAGARRLGSKVAAFLGLTEVMFAVAFSWLLLDELPLAIQLAGGLLIIAGVAAVRYEKLGDLPPTPLDVPTDDTVAPA